MTSIITTIGPASSDQETLDFFAKNSVKIARLNLSHSTAAWHNEMGQKARNAGLDLLLDLAGPKILLGTLEYNVTVENNQTIIIEKQKQGITYPYTNDQEVLVLPCQFDIHQFAVTGHTVLVDDGKLNLVVSKIDGEKVYFLVKFGGLIKTNKGMNFPETELDIDFMVTRDRELLADIIPVLRPEYIAPSFVKTVADLETLQSYLGEIKAKNNMEDYNPLICTKIEMAKAVMDENLQDIIDASDMIMIARGDLALETKPTNISVPFLQEKIKRLCVKSNKPFIVATQILETMFDSPAPSRAEISDLYRAVVLDQADFIMLSGESAAGNFAKECVSLMSQMINQQLELKQKYEI